MTSATLPTGTGVVSTYSYDNADRLTGITHVKDGSTTIASVAYTLDAVGNRTQRVDQAGTHDCPIVLPFAAGRACMDA